jgi:hypothetical protein
MLQVFHVDVPKVDLDASYVASLLDACCKRLFKMFHLFSNVCLQAFFIWMFHMFHTCYKSMFQWFQLFQSYVEASVFML